MIPEVTPSELARELASENPPRLLDVREGYELEVSRIDPVIHIPLGELPQRMGELDKDANWVIVCRSGARSGRATAFMLGQGFRSVRNLSRGMNGWSSDVDPTQPQY